MVLSRLIPSVKDAYYELRVSAWSRAQGCVAALTPINELLFKRISTIQNHLKTIRGLILESWTDTGASS